MRASGINRALMQSRSLSAGPVIAASSAAGMPSGSEGNAQAAFGACASAVPASAPASDAVIPSTAKPATPTITLHTDLFMLPPPPLLTGCNGEPTIHKFIILTMMLLFPHDPAIHWEEVSGVL